MVQQLSLTAQVPALKLQRLLLTMQTLTGNISSPMHQHTVILKPRYPFTPEHVPGKYTQIESYRVRMTRIWESGYGRTFGEDVMNAGEQDVITGESITGRNNSGNNGGNNGADSGINSSIWTIQLSDIPAGGKNSVLIQNIYETTIYQTDDVIGYLDELGYMHETEFWKYGVRYYYGNVIIEVSKLYVLDKTAPATAMVPTATATTVSDAIVVEDDTIGIAADGDSNNNRTNEDKDTMQNKGAKLRLLDGSGQSSVKAFVNVGALNDLESAAIGIKQLESLKKELADIIELSIPDRTTMDSRMNSRIAGSSGTSVVTNAWNTGSASGVKK